MKHERHRIREKLTYECAPMSGYRDGMTGHVDELLWEWMEKNPIAYASASDPDTGHEMVGPIYQRSRGWILREYKARYGSGILATIAMFFVKEAILYLLRRLLEEHFGKGPGRAA